MELDLSPCGIAMNRQLPQLAVCDIPVVAGLELSVVCEYLFEIFDGSFALDNRNICIMLCSAQVSWASNLYGPQ